MKTAYPVIFTKTSDGGYLVDIPDINRQTQGTDYPNAIEMARDYLGIWLTDLEDEGKKLPSPSKMSDIDPTKGEFGSGEVSMVDIDTKLYRRIAEMNSDKTIRRNVTIPQWLDIEAKKAKINVSKLLKNALIEELGL